MSILASSSFIEAIIPFIIFAAIFGFKIISAIAKKTNSNDRSYGETEEEDMWQPESTSSAAPPPVPTRPKRAKAAARRARGQSVETHPKGISAEAASSVMALERGDDSFENAQDRAYDLEDIDVPVSSGAAYGLTAAKNRKKRVGVNLKSKKLLRNAIVTREIMARPRCFDI